MFKKISLLIMGAGVVAAFAMPDAATATWKHHQSPIVEDISGSVTGNARFQSSLGGIECQATAAARFFANQTTGQLESYGAHPIDSTTNCKGLGGLAFCQVHNWTATELPWAFHTGPGNTITVTSGSTHATFTGAFCPILRSFTTPGTVTITPNQPNTITSGALSGTLLQHLQTTNGTTDKVEITLSGNGTIEQTILKHTYSI